MQQKRVALVTGAGGNIGSGIAERLAQDGAHVVLVDLPGRAEPVAARLRDHSVEAAAADIADEAAVHTLMAGIEARHGRLDILVNNAAISPKRPGPRWEVPLAEWEAVLRINVTAPFLLAQAAIPLMIARRWGRIVNISSQSGRTATKVAGLAYGTSKHALVGFTRHLANALGEHGITVNSVAPGPMDVLMPGTPGGVPQISSANYAIPAGRLGTAADIAAAVAYLTSEQAGFVTGAVIDVNGGTFMG